MNPIPYIATNHRIGKTLESYFLQHDLELTSVCLSKSTPSDLAGFEILLMVSPLNCNNIYVSSEAIWKKYFQLNSPDTIMLTAGFKSVEHTNYIDLLHLPADPKAFIKNARPALEKWEPPFSGGLNIEEKLQRFYQGHGDESVTDVLYTIIRIFSIAHVEMQQYDTPFADLQKELFSLNAVSAKWLELKNRWVNYIPFFHCLPFWHTFMEVDRLFDHIDPFFASDCSEEMLFWDLNCLETLKEIKDQLASICNQYVY